ncbi:MAG: hypothetical protein BMS9Abin37_1777 [Acidobacteriota bacterium]|nr:MAG: hypothetical protein BMS9Abin37_1777 [Acidobacteriota bacterium]
MRLKMFVWLALVGMTGFFLVGIAAASAQEEVYTAKMIRKKGLSTESVLLELQIRERATQEQADALLKLLNEEGSDALMQALRKGDYGEARVTGGRSRRVVWMRVFPGQNGNSVLIITDRPIYFPSDKLDEQPKPTDALGVIQLEMNDRGRGRGRLAEAVAINMTDEGVLQIQSARPATIEMEDVRREQ